MIWTLRILVACIAANINFVNPASANSDSPNVIVILTDDQGYGEFSCHGNPIAQTPHIDELAGQSVRLANFHVAPMCTPTRGQLLSGLDAMRNGATNVSSGRTLMRSDVATIADVFAENGYRTGIFGKWHLGDNYPYRPQDRGFQETLWFPSSHINSLPDYWNNDYFGDTFIHNGHRRKYEGYCTDIFFDQAMQWIQSQPDEQPFFTYIPLNAAHWPWFVEDKYRDHVRKAVEQHPEVVAHLSENRLQTLISFLAMGANIDENIGRLMRFLQAESLDENTIVVFLTDNGSTMGPDYFNAGMRGKKTTLWEGGHRVPCFIRWPRGNFETSREFTQLTHVQDLFPTLAELAKLRGIPSSLDGISLANWMRGEVDRIDDRMLVINYSRMPRAARPGVPNNRATPSRDGAGVLWKSWRLLENKRLYNLSEDPHQDRDVAGEHPEIVAKMRRHLVDWWDVVGPIARKPQRIPIGHPAENPTRLSACEWLDVFVDQQVQLRRGVNKNGVWHLNVVKPGTYRFELRRWPAESELRLDEDCPTYQGVDGEYPAGRALPIVSARIQIGATTLEAPAAADHRSVVFEISLPAGDIELQTWMLDAENHELCGAYFVTVKKM